ncbi:MAG TPA: hypothetical protein VJO16_10580 [Candidatus Acidoferrum sp.]|nr:hypothetical protein [Candidatus Acidoferrum sp.]
MSRQSPAAQRSEEKGVGESTVPPEIAVLDPNLDSDHVEVGYHGTHYARHPYSLWRDWAVETSTYAKGRDHM